MLLGKILVFPICIVLTAISATGISNAQNSAAFSFTPAAVNLLQGQTVWVDIMVNTGGEGVNAVAAYFSYSQDMLETLGVNTTGSVITLIAEQEAASGQVKISGGKPTPGFTGIYKIASVGFRAKVASGTTVLSFSSDSAILRDSDNQNVMNLLSSGKSVFTFQAVASPPPLPSPTPQPPSPSPTPKLSPTPLPQPTTLKPSPKSATPFITDVKVENVTENSALITWTTAGAADSRIEYGTTSDYQYVMTDEGVTKQHRLILPRLAPETKYLFRIVAKDNSGQEHSTTGLSFTTITLQPPLEQPLMVPSRFPGRLLTFVIISVIIGMLLLGGMFWFFIIRKR